MSFILVDNFNENINIICKDDGSGDPLICMNLIEAEAALHENCQNGIIVSLCDTISVIKRLKEMLDSGKIYIEQETSEDRKDLSEIKNELKEILE